MVISGVPSRARALLYIKGPQNALRGQSTLFAQLHRNGRSLCTSAAAGRAKPVTYSPQFLSLLPKSFLEKKLESWSSWRSLKVLQKGLPVEPSFALSGDLGRLDAATFYETLLHFLGQRASSLTFPLPPKRRLDPPLGDMWWISIADMLDMDHALMNKWLLRFCNAMKRDAVGANFFDIHGFTPQVHDARIRTTGMNGAMQVISSRFVRWLVENKKSLAGKEPAGFFPRLEKLLRLCDVRMIRGERPKGMSARKIHLHIGPTNSGKTHWALDALRKSKSGLYAGPLRLLAYEIRNRLGRDKCSLIVGDDIQRNATESHIACTAEMFTKVKDKEFDVAVLDEVQCIRDPQRGHSWTDVIRQCKCEELHLCGEPSVIGIVEQLLYAGDVLEIHRYDRLTPLSVEKKSLGEDWRRLQAQDCVICFSRKDIARVLKEISTKTTLSACAIYGDMPAEVRLDYAERFSRGEFDVLVATTTIGMGVNLAIRRVIFTTVMHPTGDPNEPHRLLYEYEAKQIAGRAGRYSVGGGSEGGYVTTFEEKALEPLAKLMKAAPTETLLAGVDIPRERWPAIQRLLKKDASLSHVFQVAYMCAHTDGIAFISDGNFRSWMAFQFDGLRMSAEDYATWLMVPGSDRRVDHALLWLYFAYEYARSKKPVMVDEWLRITNYERVRDTLGLYQESGTEAHLTDLSKYAYEKLRYMRDTGVPHEPAKTPSRSTQLEIDFNKPWVDLMDDGMLGVLYEFYVKHAHTREALEDAYAMLTVYLWIAHRFPAMFPDIAKAAELRQEAARLASSVYDFRMAVANLNRDVPDEMLVARGVQRPGE